MTVSTDGLAEHLVDELVDTLSALARGASDNMRDKNAHAGGHPRAHDIPRWSETYWSGYLHGVCAAIAALTGEDSTKIALRYEELTS